MDKSSLPVGAHVDFQNPIIFKPKGQTGRPGLFQTIPFRGSLLPYQSDNGVNCEQSGGSMDSPGTNAPPMAGTEAGCRCCSSELAESFRKISSKGCCMSTLREISARFRLVPL